VKKKTGENKSQKSKNKKLVSFILDMGLKLKIVPDS
jgi:hypothetical protein